jgi:hypothetical protein
MVSSRSLSTGRPVFPYRSKGYSILYYGVSQKGQFTTWGIKNCFKGLFPHEVRTWDFAQHAQKLVKAGLLERIDKDTWAVTNAGVRAMVSAAAFHREYKIRTTSIAYMNDVSQRIMKIHASSMSVMEKLDAEDEILEEVARKMDSRKKVKKGKKN